MANKKADFKLDGMKMAKKVTSDCINTCYRCGRQFLASEHTG